MVHEHAEGVFAIRRTNRTEAPRGVSFHAANGAVVSEREVSAAKLTHERVRVGEIHRSTGSLPDVGNREQGLDGVATDVRCKGRVRGGRWLKERPHRPSLVKR